MQQSNDSRISEMATSLRVLIAVSDPSLPLLEQALHEEGFSYSVARTSDEAIWYAEREQPILIVLDVSLGGGQGFQVCERLKQRTATQDIPVMFLSAQDDVQYRAHGLQLGAVDYLAKPFQLRELILRVQFHVKTENHRRELLAHNMMLQQQVHEKPRTKAEVRREVLGPLLGESPAVQLLRQAIQLYAPADQPVLLTGPLGAGYQSVARAIHYQSERRNQIFLYVNCATLQEEQSSSFLTTTITRDMLDGVGHRSQFFHAHDGTLFMDRMDELPLALQEKLLAILRLVQDQRSKGKPVYPDVRIVSYMMEDPHYAVQRGAFLPDLLPLLTPQRIAVPSLRERKQDIPVIADFFLQQSARRLGKVVGRIAAESTHRLMAYSWPGNIDELQQLIEREVAITQSPVLLIDTHLLEEGISLDRYRLIRKLGAGGMGEVWHAKHRWLARSAAVKWVRPDPHLPPKEKQMMIQRFQQEAQVISQLSSPYTVTLFDFGVEPSGTFYYVMELLDGMELQTLVERFGPLSPARLIRILRKVCRSLAEAHMYDLVHRDIKPENIYICKMGLEYDFPKVLDFGIVKVRPEETSGPHTEHKGAVGTPGYMAPEAVTQEYPMDGRSDLYALGCVAYWALTGRPVFLETDPIALLRKHVYGDVEPPSAFASGIPPALESLILSCMSKDPNQRPPSAEVLWDLLGQIQVGDSWTPEDARIWWERNEIPDPSASDNQATRPFPSDDPLVEDSVELIVMSEPKGYVDLSQIPSRFGPVPAPSVSQDSIQPVNPSLPPFKK